MLHAMSILFMPCSRFAKDGTSVLQHAFARTGGKLLAESLPQPRASRLIPMPPGAHAPIMLSIARIRESLRHPDADIRNMAARYFHEAHDPSTSSGPGGCGGATMGDWWAAVDALGFEAARPLLHRLENVPDTDATLTRFFDELRRELPASVWLILRGRLGKLPFDMLTRRIDDLREVRHLLAPDDLRHAEERLVLAGTPPETLWEKLLAHAAECAGRDAGGQDTLLVWRLTEALARHPEFAAPRALGILRDESIEDWREIFAIELAGALRCREAIDPLIGKLRIDSDYMLECARAALVRIGDPGIPARIAADWEDEEWGFRNYAHGAIASFRVEENVALLRDLIAREADKELQIFMAVSLLEMLPDDAATLEFVRQLVLKYPAGTPIEALDLELATAAAMGGWDFPEHAEWRARAIAQEERMRRLGDHDESSMAALRSGMIAGLSFREASESVFGARPEEFDDWDEDGAPSLPFIRETPKVGRNDPCPCNSGKKFKKCCGKAA